MRPLIYITAAVILLGPMPGRAQSTDMPLGDLARALRKKQAAPQSVIDNDNLSAVMEAGENKDWGMGGLRFSLGQDAIQMVNASHPDVTCALSFNAQVPGLKGQTVKPQTLPDSELGKLDGPASIVDNMLQISVHNGSDWSLQEITVGLTLVRRSSAPLEAFSGGPLKLIPAAVNTTATTEKRSDTTVLYHLKATAAPLSTTLFRETLNSPIGPEQEWHWAIVEAKGTPPQPKPPDVD